MMLNKLQKSLLNIPSSAWALLLILALVTLLWLPFGLNTTVITFEEWPILRVLQEGDFQLFTPDLYPTRPLNLAAYNLINLLWLSDLGLGYNLTLIGLFIAKSWIVYVILRRLIPQNPYIPLMTALLFIIYPADTGLFTFRALAAQIAIVLGLTAVYLLVRCWQQPSLPLWIAIGFFQILSVWVNEVMYPVLFASPLLLLWLDRRLTRRFWKVSALWLIIPTILFSRLILSIAQPDNSDTYIVQRIEQSQAGSIINFSTMLNRIESLYARHLSEWGVIATEFNHYSAYLPAALMVGLLMSVVSWRHFNRIHKRHTPVTNLVLLAAGLGIILIGHAPFLLLPYEGTYWHVYYVSSLGAALFVSVLIYWLTWRLPALTIAISGILLTLASISALNQHAFYADISIYFQRLFAGIVAQAPQIDPKATIVVMDDTGIYHSQWITASFDNVISPVISHLYDDLLKGVYCNTDDLSQWGEISCDMRSYGVYRVFLGKASMIPYSQMIVFRVKKDGEVVLVDQMPGAHGYKPHRLINQDAPLPDRARSFFACWPLDSCFPLNSPPQAEIRLDFDRMIRGVGWESGDPGRRQLFMMRGHRSTIVINPVIDTSLEIQFRISNAIGQDVIDSLKFEVNGHFVQLEKIDAANQIFGAAIPATFLQDETELAFNVSRVAGTYDISLEFDWLEIKPLDISHYIRVEFDDEINGTGWEAPTANRSQRWTQDTLATMNLNLPTDKDLQIQFKIDLYLQQDILDSLRLMVNDQPIALEKGVGTDLIFRGVIPKSALRDETDLAFIVDRVVSPASLGINEDTRGLGLLFDWLEIRSVP